MSDHTARRAFAACIVSTAAVALAACGPQAVSPASALAPGPSIKGYVLLQCIDFEAPTFSLGATYGPPDPPGTVAFSVGGIQAVLREFHHALPPPPPPSYTLGSVVANPFGTGQTLNLNNISLDFDFTGPGTVPDLVEIDILDKGGHENLAVNGPPLSVFIGDLVPGAPLAFPGVTASVAPGAKWQRLVIEGTVKNVVIGGQEFWIDNVCSYAQPTPTPTDTPRPSDTPTPAPTPTPTPIPETCPDRYFAGKSVPPEAFTAALADPGAVYGWQYPCDPGLPPAHWLMLTNPNVPYDKVANPLIFKCGCPGPAPRPRP